MAFKLQCQVAKDCQSDATHLNIDRHYTGIGRDSLRHFRETKTAACGKHRHRAALPLPWTAPTAGKTETES